MNIKLKALPLILLIFTTVIIGRAQETKAMAEVVNSSEKIVKDMPFSAEAVSESIQVLGDGNRIIRKTTNKMYRDGTGRFRREQMPQPGGTLGSMVETPPTILIIDPTTGFKYFLNKDTKTIRQSALKMQFDFKYTMRMEEKKIFEEKLFKNKQDITNDKKQIENKQEKVFEKKEEIEDRIAEKNSKRAQQTAKHEETEERMSEKNAKRAEQTDKKASINAEQFERNIKLSQNVNPSDKRTKTESLGVKNIEGIDVEGTRSTTTIDAGTIGNERPIDIVYEKWYSKDLQLIVMSKHTDPRFGEQSYRLTNIKRSEPDRSLFSLPGDYKILNPMPPKNLKPPVAPAKPSPEIKEPEI